MSTCDRGDKPGSLFYHRSIPVLPEHYLLIVRVYSALGELGALAMTAIDGVAKDAQRRQFLLPLSRPHNGACRVCYRENSGHRHTTAWRQLVTRSGHAHALVI
jgi:hypothetical protein